MADFNIQGTGVANLHYSFAKKDDLIIIKPKVGDETSVYANDNAYIKRYDTFAQSMDNSLGDKKEVVKSEFNKLVRKVSHKIEIDEKKLMTPRYVDRYIREKKLKVLAANAHSHRVYKQKYAKYKRMREEFPEYEGQTLFEFFEHAGRELGLSPHTIKGSTYEWRWMHDDN